jgi:hypothetical protein
MLDTKTDVAELGRRISELGVMLTRTALDESEPVSDRETEVLRLVHLIRRRLDDCSAITELRPDEADADFDEFVSRVMEPYEVELRVAA